MRRMLRFAAQGVLAVLLLFWFLHWAITPREHRGAEPGPLIEGVSMVKPMEDRPTPPDPLTTPDKLPPPPPDAPPSLAAPALPALSAPALTNVTVDAGPVTVAVNVNTSGLGLGSGAFGGFLRGGAGGGGGGGGGSGGGGAGYGGGKSFSGATLIPLSTARPQMPEWACKQKIKGWVEVVFVVLPNGRVQDVKIVDADPRGVYEAAAIESVSNWIYSPYSKAREVKQRVPMDPEDCAYNWQ